MNNSPNHDSFIPEVQNYCDRWCERCPFTQRCRVFAMEQESPDDGADIETVVQNLAGIFAEAKQMLIEKAGELGVDPFAISDEEFAAIRRREKEFVDGDELSHLADQYWRSAKEILDGDLTRYEDSMAEILSVLEWYLFFIPVKVKCGLNGLLDHDGFEDASQLTNSQSFANGTVKIGLIAIERSLLAWNQLAEAGFSGGVRTVSDLLETIKVKLEKRFPLARDFIRPGFDEIDVVM